MNIGNNFIFTTVAFCYCDLSNHVYQTSQWVIEEHDCGMVSSRQGVLFMIDTFSYSISS
jgi:hypothetical protein